MPTNIIRIIFLMLSCVSGYIIVQNVSTNPTVMQSFQGIALGLAVPIVIFALEVILKRYFIEVVAGIMFGITAGFIISYIILQSLNILMPENELVKHFQLPIILVVCYTSVAIVLQTKDKFKFIIPYVEFRSKGKAPDFLILDSSSIIDGRIFNLLQMKMFPEKVVIPQFILDELQALSDSSDKLKREKGKIALTTVQKMKEDIFFNIEIFQDAMPGIEGADSKIIALGEKINGRVVTTDSNLAKVAAIEAVPVLNIHEMAMAFRPDMITGEQFEIEVKRKGESRNQGVGYLQDGTMVVIENGRDKIGQQVLVEVTNTMQTSSGKMFFVKIV